MLHPDMNRERTSSGPLLGDTPYSRHPVGFYVYLREFFGEEHKFLKQFVVFLHKGGVGKDTVTANLPLDKFEIWPGDMWQRGFVPCIVNLVNLMVYLFEIDFMFSGQLFDCFVKHNIPAVISSTDNFSQFRFFRPVETDSFLGAQVSPKSFDSSKGWFVDGADYLGKGFLVFGQVGMDAHDWSMSNGDVGLMVDGACSAGFDGGMDDNQLGFEAHNCRHRGRDEHRAIRETEI